MGYPDFPFTDDFKISLVTQIRENADCSCDNVIQNSDLNVLFKWLCLAPNVTTFRVNTLKCCREDLLSILQNQMETISVVPHKLFPEVVYFKHCNLLKSLKRHKKEIVVDSECGAAILRGANIFAPGVIGMVAGCRVGDTVSIFVDAVKKCRKGFQKIYESDQKIFVANGTCKMDRSELFVEDNIPKSGIAIEIIENISGCPSMRGNLLPLGWALLQNLPSIICVNILNPKPNEKIIDMCAAPGNKTTHIAQLMENKGILVAIDKTPNKIEKLKQRCQEFDAMVYTFLADSRKIHTHEQMKLDIEKGPPFLSKTFDKVLLDAPCSALGKRPQFLNVTSEKMLKSYVPLQRKLFETGVEILKENGILVYSTCTITLAENEGMVAWALKTFPCLILEKPETKFCLGEPGWPGTSLTEEQRHNVQRFGPNQHLDSVGFFVARFVKSIGVEK